MSSTSYAALGGSRLAGRDRTIYWTEADPSASGLHHIVAASARGKLPVVRAILLPPSRMRGLVATERHLIWHDGAMLRLAAIVEGAEVMHVAEPGLAWLTCLIADRTTAYYARANDSGGSVIGAVEISPAQAATTRELAEVAGTVDQLVVGGDHLAWTLHGASDVYVQAKAGGAPALLYSASGPFALCAAGADHLVLAVGATLVRLALATGEVAPLADQLAAGWPHAVVWHAGVAYVARHEVVVSGARLGSCVERVDLAEGTAHVVHAPAAGHRIDHMVANDHGAFCLESSNELVAIVHITPEPVARTVIEQRGTRTGGGIRIDSAYGKLRAGFVGEVTSCAELVKRIASEAPRRLELLCAPASPGDLWSSACVGHALPSVEALVAPNGALGQLADMFSALPSLRQAFVAGELALEPFEHAMLRELHFESETLRPTFAKALASSRLPALERCALTFKRISTASLLRLVEALTSLRGALRIVHFGGLRGPDQIRDVMSALTERRVGWELVSFNGALGGEEQWLEVAESIKPPASLRVALPLADMLGAGAAAQLRRYRWLCEVAEIGWEPGVASF